MRVAVIQPSYAPWLGYMYMMKSVDLFIYYDCVQYDKNGWRNRNRILADGKVKWLTLSIDKGSLGSSLEERRLSRVMLADNNQFVEHKRLLSIYYRAAEYINLLEFLYPRTKMGSKQLVESVIAHTEGVAELLNLGCNRIRSSELSLDHSDHTSLQEMPAIDRKNAKLLNILKEVGCTEYISGQAARSYLNEELFMKNSISVKWNPFKGDMQNLSVLHYLLTLGAGSVLDLIS